MAHKVIGEKRLYLFFGTVGDFSLKALEIAE